jgi:hypothetical protein
MPRPPHAGLGNQYSDTRAVSKADRAGDNSPYLPTGTGPSSPLVRYRRLNEVALPSAIWRARMEGSTCRITRVPPCCPLPVAEDCRTNHSRPFAQWSQSNRRPEPRSSRYMNAPAHSPKQLRYAILNSLDGIVEINWPYLAAALVACYCPPAQPVESIRSPACEQTELASSSRYLPLAIGGTCSPILEE